VILVGNVWVHNDPCVPKGDVTDPNRFPEIFCAESKNCMLLYIPSGFNSAHVKRVQAPGGHTSSELTLITRCTKATTQSAPVRQAAIILFTADRIGYYLSAKRAQNAFNAAWITLVSRSKSKSSMVIHAQCCEYRQPLPQPEKTQKMTEETTEKALEYV
jgi:hypothetical protein